MAYIYKITNELNAKCYIGKTEYSNPEKRFQEHLKEATKERSEIRPLYRAIRKYGKENFSFEVIEKTSSPEEREVYWIEHFGSYGKGYNATLGGDGRKYLNHEKILEDYGRLQNMNEVAVLNDCSSSSVAKILKSQGIETLSGSQSIGRKKAKAVEQYSKEGELLKTFPSIIAAGKSLGDEQKYKHISEVCNKKRKTAYGFIWKFKE